MLADGGAYAAQHARDFHAGNRITFTHAEKMAYKAGQTSVKERQAKKKATSKKKGRKGGRGRGGYGGGAKSIIYPNVVGYGDYHMNPNDSFGTRWGGQLGAFGGELLGGAAQALITSAIAGLGDYSVKSNTLLAPSPPTIINDSVKGGITFRHKEYLRDIITSATPGAFSLESFLINPGNEKTFPWLAQVAPNFEQYSLEGCIFEFRSMSADALNSTNTALGTVIMATNYDSIDVNFTGKGEMENYEWGMSCKPSVNMLHPIECAPRQTSITELYVLNGPVPTGADPRLYHWGNMQIATNGFQGTSVNIGELWVTYQVRLLKPKIFTTKGLEVGSFFLNNDAYTNALPLGSGNITSRYDSIGIVFDPANNNIGFPIQSVKKHYLVNIVWVGSILAVTHPLVTLTEATFTSVAGSPSVQMVVPPNGQTASRISQTYTIMVNANAFGVISYGTAGTLPSSGSSVGIRITEINPFSFG